MLHGAIKMTGKNCPQWGNAMFYDDCELCPTFNECMEIQAEDSKRYDGGPDVLKLATKTEAKE